MSIFTIILGLLNVIQTTLWSIIYLWTVWLGYGAGSILGAAVCIFFPIIPSYYFAWKGVRLSSDYFYYTTFAEIVGIATITSIITLAGMFIMARKSSN